jgi:hypothetical protein
MAQTCVEIRLAHPSWTVPEFFARRTKRGLGGPGSPSPARIVDERAAGSHDGDRSSMSDEKIRRRHSDWAAHMQGMLEANRPAHLGAAMVDTMCVYEAMRTGDETEDAHLRHGLAKGFEAWRLEQVRLHAAEKDQAEGDAGERNATAIADTMAYRNEIRDTFADFLSRTTVGSGGHAVIMLVSIFNDYKTGNEFHDQALAAGLGLAFDAWAEREKTFEKALKGPRGQA